MTNNHDSAAMSYAISPEGRYFMTQEDKAKDVGVLVLRRKEAEQRLVLLEEKGKEIGQYLSALGSALQSNAATTIFDEQSVDSSFGAQLVFQRKNYPPLDELLRLTDDARKTILEMSQATESLRRFGI
jgi:hypothetical protein